MRMRAPDPSHRHVRRGDREYVWGVGPLHRYKPHKTEGFLSSSRNKGVTGTLRAVTNGPGGKGGRGGDTVITRRIMTTFISELERKTLLIQALKCLLYDHSLPGHKSLNR